MKDFLKKHPDLGLIVLALFFVGVIAGYFSWGIGSLIENVGGVVAVNQSPAEGAQFNLSGAQALDLKGLVQ